MNATTMDRLLHPAPDSFPAVPPPAGEAGPDDLAGRLRAMLDGLGGTPQQVAERLLSYYLRRELGLGDAADLTVWPSFVTVGRVVVPTPRACYKALRGVGCDWCREPA